MNIEPRLGRVAAAVAVIALSACATSPVTSTGPDTYSLSATRCGLCEPVTSYVTQEAGKYCQSQGKHIAVLGVSSNDRQPMFPGSATINFTCSSDNSAAVSSLTEECQKDMQSAELNSIRDKVELMRLNLDAPPPFAMASNQAYPTDTERQAIAKWASLRESCQARSRAARKPPATPLQRAVYDQEVSFGDEVVGKVSALIVALYQGKLTYGEFAQRRYEFARDGAAAEREYRQATLIADQQRAMQAEQLAQQNFQNKLAAWSTYIQAVNSRPSQTVVNVNQNVTVH